MNSWKRPEPAFLALHDQGIDVMVSRIDISYKHSLRGSDRFVVKVAYQREGVKLVFFEDIYKIPEQVLCARGRIEAICLQNGKLTRGELFETIFINKVEKKQVKIRGYGKILFQTPPSFGVLLYK